MLKSKYSVIYFLTWNCNLGCHYCYETRKKEQNMSWEVARDGVDFFMNKYQKVNFQFFGGEPLVQFELMKKITDYLRIHYVGRYGLSIITNGTLVTDEVIDFFLKNNVFVTLSMDGSKETQDMNRRFKNNQGTFLILEPLLKKIIAYRIRLRIRMTITPDNCAKLFDNMNYFIEELGITDLQEEVDRFTKWDENHLTTLINQYDEIINYLIMRYKSDPLFYWKNYEERISPFLGQTNMQKKARCGSSEGMCSLDTNGLLYPCQKFIVNQTLSIGNIYDGFNEIQRDIVKNYILPNYLKETRNCKNCEFIHSCFAGCIAENYINDTDQIQDCKFRRLHKSMHKKFYDELSRNNIELRKPYTKAYSNVDSTHKALVYAEGCGAEGCGAEGGVQVSGEGCGAEGCCDGEGCGSEGCGAEF